MRKSFAAVAVVAALAIATPAAASSGNDRSQTPSIVQHVKNMVKKVFKVRSTSVPIIPIPRPTGG